MSSRIIIPVRNEAPNIRRLVREIGETTHDTGIYFVDDSTTLETVEEIYAAKREFPHLAVGVLHREGSDRTGGIVGAVTAGMALARLEGVGRVVVMDGDGQHDPAYVPAMLTGLERVDLVVGSRYIPGGSREGLAGPLRLMLSQGATLAAKTVFPQLTSGVSDPMSGYFAVNLDALDLEKIQADGFKVQLDILLTHPGLGRAEVPVVFRKRFDGKSKADASVGLKYLHHLARRRLEIPVMAPARDFVFERSGA